MTPRRPATRSGEIIGLRGVSLSVCQGRLLVGGAGGEHRVEDVEASATLLPSVTRHGLRHAARLTPGRSLVQPGLPIP